MVEFHLIISAVQPDISPAMLRHLMLGIVAILASGYCCESVSINAGMSFAFYMAGWVSILFEVCMGDVGSVDANSNMNKHVKTAFSIMRFIVKAGWAISIWIIPISMEASPLFC